MDFPVSDPIEIIKRLMIGSEGTLGFVSRATYNTVPEWPNKVCIIASDASKLPRSCLWCSGILQRHAEPHLLQQSHHAWVPPIEGYAAGRRGIYLRRGYVSSCPASGFRSSLP